MTRFYLAHDDRVLADMDLMVAYKAVENLLSGADLKCAACNHDMNIGTPRIDLYDHSHGWNVGLKSDQWVSLHCPTCGYDTSINKLKPKGE